jgi:hypothetical protein
MKAIGLIPILLATSCGMYNSNFDCLPGQGVGCKSVNDVLQMIVEQENGEDLFASEPTQEKQLVLRREQKGVLVRP